MIVPGKICKKIIADNSPEFSYTKTSQSFQAEESWLQALTISDLNSISFFSKLRFPETTSSISAEGTFVQGTNPRLMLPEKKHILAWYRNPFWDKSRYSFLKMISVNCAETFGIKCGDVVRFGNSEWYQKRILILGYALGSFWGQEIDIHGNLSGYLQCPAHPILLRSWGDYELEEFGINPQDIGGLRPSILTRVFKALTLSRSVKHEWILERIRMARSAGLSRNKSDVNNKSISEALKTFIVTILKAETVDVFRRLNHVVDLTSFQELESMFLACRSMDKLNKTTQDFISAVQSLYSENIREEIQYSFRYAFSCFPLTQVVKVAFQWIQKDLEYKTGLRSKVELSNFNSVWDFTHLLQQMLQELFEYIAPLYSAKKENAAVKLFQTKPVYFNDMLTRFPDPQTAASHILATCLGAVSEIFERSVFYDFQTDALDQSTHNRRETIFFKILSEVGQTSKERDDLKTLLLYHDRDVYSVFPAVPPAASKPNVLRLQTSTGCNNRCSFCTLYEDEPYTLIKQEPFRRQLSLIREYLGAEIFENIIDRIFLSGGNSLSMPNKRLTDIINHIHVHRRSRLRRIEIYGHTKSILKQGVEGLKALSSLGLSMVYWGIESAYDPVLELTNKGYTQRDILEAGSFLHKAKIGASVMLMPGLGGKLHADEHARESGRVVGKIAPRRVTLMTVFAPGTDYDKKINETKYEEHFAPGLWNRLLGNRISEVVHPNRPLNDKEMIAHIDDMTKWYISYARSTRRRTVIGAYSASQTPTARNPISFQYTLSPDDDSADSYVTKDF